MTRAFCSVWLGLGLELFFSHDIDRNELVLSSLVNITNLTKCERKCETAL